VPLHGAAFVVAYAVRSMSLGAGPPPHESPCATTVDADTIALPDYGGAWIGALLPALVAGATPPGAPPWVAQARQRVLLLIDGLGWELYRRFATSLPSLADVDGTRITAVVPTTTATALPSLTTGRTPGEHGMLGDRMRVGGRVLSVLQWTVPRGRPPSPETVQPHRPFDAGAVVVVSHQKFAGSDFSAAHLRGAPYHGYEDIDDLVRQVGACLDDGAPVVYAYLPDLDRTAHERGLEHDAFGHALALCDRVVRGIRRRLPPGAALLVTADHGHVTTDPAKRIDLRPLLPMVSAMAGSTRMRYLHARSGAANDLLAAAREIVGSAAWVHDRAQVVASGWLGPTTRPVVAGRLGDVILSARGTATLVDPGDPLQARLLTMHGSLTPADMYVPLLAARG
jgi:hypothetical protein